MGLLYKSLDAVTRTYMLAEHELGGHYESPRLRPNKFAEWKELFYEALQHHHDDWLAQQTKLRCLLKETETRERNGNMYEAKVPSNAAQQLAEGEFNRFYLRGIAARSEAEGTGQLKIYRGRHSSQPRPESEAKIGTFVASKVLLTELRATDFLDRENQLGVPGGPSSGLTAHLLGDD